MSSFSQRLGLSRYEADEFYAQALDARERGKLTEATDQITNAITLLPSNSEYYAARGIFHLESGAAGKAKADFKQALKLHSGEMLANYGMGVVAYGERDWDDAVSWFNKARAVNPAQPEIPYYLSLVYHRQQDNRTAKVYMLQAQQLMEDAEDKRKADAKRWIREYEKLIRQAERMTEEDEKPMVQKGLPLAGEESGIRISREELEATSSSGELEAGATDDESDEDE